MKIESKLVLDLKPATYNPRQISTKQYKDLKVSIKKFGLVDPIIINKDNTVIGGHQRLKICKELKYIEIDCVVLDLSKEEERATGKLRNIYNQIESDFNRPDDFYIFPSELTRREVENIFKRKLDDSVVIPNGVSGEFFKKSEAKRNHKSVGFVGRSHRIKNMAFLIALAREFKIKNNNFEISAVSRISSNKTKEVMEKEGVKIINEMSANELREFYRMSGVIISPSHFETYGNVPIEAVASGTPALVSEHMGVSETFATLDLERFVIEDFNNVSEVSERVEELSEYEVGETTRERIQNSLGWDSIMGRYFDSIRKRFALPN